VIGSQAILGTYPEYELPDLATRSMEVDILPLTDDSNTTIELADLIVGVAGELSPFEQTHGFSIDGVDLTTAALPVSDAGHVSADSGTASDTVVAAYTTVGQIHTFATGTVSAAEAVVASGGRPGVAPPPPVLAVAGGKASAAEPLVTERVSSR
jgi:hypothetical protein